MNLVDRLAGKRRSRYPAQMTRDQLIASIKAREADIRAEGVVRLALFGSRARGDNRPDSDVDVLIDVPRGVRFSLLNLTGVAQLIEDATGLPSSVVLDRDLDPDFDAVVRPDLAPVF